MAGVSQDLLDPSPGPAVPLPGPPPAGPAAAPPGLAVSPRLLALAAVLIALSLAPWISGLVGALVLGIVLAPVHGRLRRVLPARWSAGLLAAAVVVLIAVPGSWLVTQFVGQAADALTWLQRSNVLARLDGTRFGGIDIGRQLGNTGAALLGWLSGRALAFFGSATRATVNLFIALFGLYYLLLEGPALGRRAAALLRLPPALAALLAERFRTVTEALLVGTMLTAAVQGTIVGVGFAIVGLRGPVLWGVVTACVSVLPMFGSAIVWLPGVLVLAASQRYAAAILLLVIGGGLAANMDNVVRLVAYRRISGIHPMVTLVGAAAGVGVFGIAGALVGPLALSYFFELLRLYEAGSAPPG